MLLIRSLFVLFARSSLGGYVEPFIFPQRLRAAVARERFELVVQESSWTMRASRAAEKLEGLLRRNPSLDIPLRRQAVDLLRAKSALAEIDGSASISEWRGVIVLIRMLPEGDTRAKLLHNALARALASAWPTEFEEALALLLEEGSSELIEQVVNTLLTSSPRMLDAGKRAQAALASRQEPTA